MSNKIKILIVEDDWDFAELISTYLEKNNYSTIIVEGAVKALEVLSREKIDLVLIDFVLPDFDGAELCKKILADPKYLNIPVIFLSAYHSMENRLKAYETGAVDFLSKPIDNKELLERIKLHLELRNLRAEKLVGDTRQKELFQKLTQEIDKNKELMDIQKKLIDESEKSRKVLLSMLEDEKALLNEKSMLTHTIDQSVNEIYIFDAETFKFIYVNQGAIRNLGYSFEELKEMTPLDLKISFSREDFVTQLIEPLLSGATNQKVFETVHYRKDQSCYPIEVNLQMSEYNGKKVFLAIILDITEKLKIRKQLEESHQLYQNLFENTGTATILVSKEGKIIMANDECRNVTGYSKEQLIDTPWVNYVSQESLPMMMEYFKSRFSSEPKAPNRYIAKLIHASGEIRETLMNIGAQKNADYVIVSMIDITELKKTQQKLTESEEKYRLLVENAFETISVVQHGKIIFSNANLQKLTGYTLEELNEGNPLRIVPEEDRMKIIDYMKQRHVKDDVPEQYEFRIIDKTGKVKWLERRVRKIEWEGAPASLVFDNDITEKYAKELELKNSELQWRITFDAIQDGILLLDKNQKILKFNKSFSEKFKFLSTLSDSPFCFHIVHKTNCPIEGCPFLRVKVSKKRESMEMIMNGNTYLVTVDPILDENNEFQGAVHVITDITMIKQIESTLRKNQAQLQALLNYIPALILIKDSDLRAIYANEKFSQYFPFEEWKHRRPEELFPPEIANDMIAKDTEALEKGYCSYEETWTDLHGIEHIYYTQKFRIEVTESEALLGAIIQDITERVKAENELKLYRENLEKLVEERTRELAEKNAELERMNKLFVGREFRIKELKDKIEELEEKLSKMK